LNLFYRDHGSGDPLIILHGLFGSGMNWNTLAKYFGEEYQVFLVDQRNHGRSPHDDLFNYSVMAQDLADFMDQQHIVKASIIGHSMGAKTATTFALSHPEKVNKLVAVDMGVKHYPVQDDDLQKGLLSLDFNSIQSRAEADMALATYISDNRIRAFIMQNLHWGPDKKMEWRMNVAAIIDNIDEIGKAVEVQSAYEGEVLFVKAANSDYILPDDHKGLLEKFPNALIEEIAGAGHWIHADNPADFGAAVLRFLNS